MVKTEDQIFNDCMTAAFILKLHWHMPEENIVSYLEDDGYEKDMIEFILNSKSCYDKFLENQRILASD
jgi:hypothetical protein